VFNAFATESFPSSLVIFSHFFCKRECVFLFLLESLSVILLLFEQLLRISLWLVLGSVWLLLWLLLCMLLLLLNRISWLLLLL